MHFGMSIGLVCLTKGGSIIVCTLCAPQVEFSKLLNFISHITREHGCISEHQFDYSKKVISEVIDANFSEECIEYGISCKTSRLKDYLQRNDSSMRTMETTPNSSSLNRTKQELGNEININIVKNEKDNINMVEINSTEFYCPNCKTRFLSGKELVQHICSNISQTCIDEVRIQNQRIHANERNYKCEICNTTFSTIRGFHTHKSRIHQKTHQTTNKFSCVKCDANFPIEKELLKHNCSNDESSSVEQAEAETGAAIIKNNNKYCCTICSAKLKTSSTLKNHMATHHAKKTFKCKYCPQSCINSSTLKQHLQTHEPSSGKTVTCPHCAAILKSRDTLRYHLLTHTAQKTFTCDYCNGRYYTPSKLTAHLKSIHAALFGKEFRCAFCSAILPSQKSLKFHILKHKGDKPYKCEHCPLAFYRSYVLKRHVLTHSGKKPYKCDQCSSAFYLKGKLKEHMITHSGKKPYNCEQCSSGFYHAAHLKRHMVTHSGKKPYKCEQCSSGFLYSAHLKRHMVTHSEKKPFNCEHSVSLFTRKHSLNLRIKTHTEIEITNEEVA